MAHTSDFGVQSLEARQLLSGDGAGASAVADLTSSGAVAFAKPSLTAIKVSPFSVSNGGFETFTPNDLQAWTIGGNAASVINDYYTAPEGISQALISNGLVNGPGRAAALAATDLEKFLGAPTGSLTKKGVVNGSAIKQTFKSGSLELLTFQLDFLTNETTKSDFAFVSLNDGRSTTIYKVGDRLHTASTAAAGTGMLSETGYNRYTLLLPKAGTYTVGFGVTNVGSTITLSTVIVDNVQLIPLLPFDLHIKSVFGDDRDGFRPRSFGGDDDR